MQSTNRIRNETKDTNKLSPQNSFRASLQLRRASAMINNSQQLLEHLQNKQRNQINYRRRMSSIEQVYEKSSNIRLYNLENIKSCENSKIDLANMQQKSLSNITESETGTIERPILKKGRFKQFLTLVKLDEFTDEREEYSLYIFSEDNR